jgi:hypothetical protein
MKGRNVIYSCLLTFGLIPHAIFAQQGPGSREDGGLTNMEEIEDFDKKNIGLRMGISFNTILGTELVNPRPFFSYAGGFYYQKQLLRGRPYWLYTETSLRFAGSNFANYKLSSDYTRITQLYLDVPLLLKINLSGSRRDDKGRNLLIGPQAGHLLKSAIYLGEYRVPKNALVWWKRWENLAFAPFDLNAVAAYEISRPRHAFMITARYGLININRGLYFDDLTPVTGKGGTIRNASIDFSFLF